MNYTDSAKILYESEQNDMAIFEAIIKSDMYTLSKKDSSICEAELLAIEGKTSEGFFTKIAAYIERLAKKIGEMIDDFCTRFKQALQPNGVAYIALYQNKITDSNGQFIHDLSNFKYKFRKRTPLQINVDRIMDIYQVNAGAALANIADDDKQSIDKIMNSYREDNSFVCELLNSTITNFNGTDKIKDFASYKELVEEKAFDDEKEYTGFTIDNYNAIFIFLTNVNNKAINKIQKSKKTAIADLKKQATEFRSDGKSNKPKSDIYKANAQYELMRDAERTYITAFNSFMWILKTELSEYKTLYAKLGRYNPDTKSEDTELEDYIDSAIYEETYNMI